MLVDVRIPDPEPAVLTERRIGGEAEKPSLIVRSRCWIAEARESRNPGAEGAHLRTEIQEDRRVGCTLCREALSQNQPGLRAYEDGIADDVDVRDQVDLFHDRPQ